MRVEQHHWYTGRLGREMGVRVYGHFGYPLLVFPTSGGDEREYEGQGMIDALGHHIEAGRVKVFCINSVNNESWYDKEIHPRQRSFLQAKYDEYVAAEVFPFIRTHCSTADIAITTTGSSFGAYHAANTLLKHPDVVRRCLAMSGIYDVRRYMDGDADENFYFNNPVDYMANLSDPWYLHHLRQCDIRLITGTGPWEHPEWTYQLSDVLNRAGVPHSVDNWGAEGGHDWPYWKRQMDRYLGGMY
jgi:esterase/lipase superfamily enzyme